MAGDTSNALLEDAVEQIAIYRIKELRGAGLSYRAICRRLDEEGIKPRRAIHWSPIVVQRISTGTRTATKAKTSTRVARARAEFMGASPATSAVG